MKHHPQGQVARDLQALERSQRRLVFHIVNAGHAQPVRLRLRVPKRRIEECRRRDRQVRQHQLDGTLQEKAGRLARCVPENAAAGWVRSVPGDSGSREGRAVDPGRVDVERVQVDRSGLHRVERRAVRRLLPAIGIPTLADHPALQGCHAGDPVEGGLAALRARQPHPPPAQRPKREMGVAIHEARSHQRIWEIVDRGSSRHPPRELGGASDRDDPAIPPPHGVAPGGRVEGEDAARSEQAGRHAWTRLYATLIGPGGRFPHVDNPAK